MKQVIYTSATTRSFDGPALEVMLQRIRPRNMAFGISGIVLIHSGSLLHVLEGPDPYLSTTFSRILRDPRHTSLNILSVKEVDHREFGDQPMALYDTTEEPTTLTGPLADFRLRPLLTLNEATARRILQALRRRPHTDLTPTPSTLNFIHHDSSGSRPAVDRLPSTPSAQLTWTSPAR